MSYYQRHTNQERYWTSDVARSTAGAAALEVWGDRSDMLYTGIDMSQSMLDAAKIMLSGKQMQSIFYDRVADISRRALREGSTYDLIVCSFTLTELANDHLRRTATQLLYELLSVDGLLVIIESGDPTGSHTTRTARRFILETGQSGSYETPQIVETNVSVCKRLRLGAPSLRYGTMFAQ